MTHHALSFPAMRMGAWHRSWLGGRGLTYGGRGAPIPSERSVSARSLQVCTVLLHTSKRIASGVEGSAAAQPLLQSSWRLGGECSSQPARLVHSSLAFAVPCQAEALGVPSSSRFRSFFRIFLAFTVHAMCVRPTAAAAYQYNDKRTKLSSIPTSPITVRKLPTLCEAL